MIDLSPGVITIIMLGGILVFVVVTGFPIALVVGSVGLIVGYLVFGDTALEIMYTRVYSLSLN